MYIFLYIDIILIFARVDGNKKMKDFFNSQYFSNDSFNQRGLLSKRETFIYYILMNKPYILLHVQFCTVVWRIRLRSSNRSIQVCICYARMQHKIKSQPRNKEGRTNDLHTTANISVNFIYFFHQFLSHSISCL